jgi:hypothetical protein
MLHNVGDYAGSAMLSSFRLLGALACATLFGCGESENNGSGVRTIMDADGLPVTLSQPSDQSAFEIASSPAWSIGGPDATGPAQFAGIRSIVALSSGEIWVADQTSGELRVFDSEGGYLTSLGGRGEGPTEYIFAHILGVLAGDTVVAVDQRMRRRDFYTRDGRLVRQISAATTDIQSARHLSVLDGDAFVGLLPNYLDASELAPGTVLDDDAVIHLWDAAGEVVGQIATAPTVKWIWTGENQIQMPLTRAMGWSAHAGELHLTTGAEFLIRVFSPDGQVRSYGLDAPPRAATTEIRDAYADWVASLGEDTRSRYEQGLRETGFPDEAYAYARLVSGPGGSTWAWLMTPSLLDTAEWHVYDSEGAFLGSVQMPDRFILHQVLEDGVVGIWFDEFDVEHVRKYPFTGGDSVPN